MVGLCPERRSVAESFRTQLAANAAAEALALAKSYFRPVLEFLLAQSYETSYHLSKFFHFDCRHRDACRKARKMSEM